MRISTLLLLNLTLSALPALAADPPAAAPDAGKPGTPAAPAAAPAPAAANPATAADPAAAPASPAGTPAAAAATAAPVTDPAAPSAREAELAALVPAHTVEDELVWLNAADGKFFAFRRNPSKGEQPRAALLIVPGPRAFIDQNPLTTALREVPRHGGFSTLAVQVPLSETAPPVPETPAAPPADPAATPPPAAPAAPVDALCGRLTAALALLESTNPPYIALVAEDESADRVQACYSTGLPPSVKAFAAIGPWRGKLAEMKVPSIEFVPARNARAMKEADRRKLSTPKPSAPYRREDIDAVDQHFKGAEQEVAKRLRGWLEKVPSPGAAPAPPVSG